MKKFYKYLLLVVSLLLSSCSDRSYYFNYDEMIEKVVKIEVYETYGSGKPDNYKTFLFALDDELIDNFLLDLSKIEFIRPCMICNLSFPEGKSFFIYCNNEERFIINDNATTIGTIPDYYISEEDFDYLLYKYYWTNYS